jgi:outer membrane lipoprotein carrier protein
LFRRIPTSFSLSTFEPAMKILLKVLPFLACFVALSAEAGGREQLTAFAQGLTGLDGRFEQRVYDANGQQTEKSAGAVQLSVPRQFRWEYQTPARQLIVADGDRIWVYDPELEQVTVRNQSFDEQSSPLAVLIDPTELDRRYKVAEGGKAGGLEWLALTPKQSEDAAFISAKLGFGPKGLARMELEDALGQHTSIVFSAWARNPKFARGLFSFTAPKGADVVGDAGPMGAVVTPLRD